VRHDHEAERIKNGTDTEHPVRAKTVGDSARKGLTNSPQQILDGDCEREDIASPVIGL
jgi:hypothetical protein